jgi:hypothetical protein
MEAAPVDPVVQVARVDLLVDLAVDHLARRLALVRLTKIL